MSRSELFIGEDEILGDEEEILGEDDEFFAGDDDDEDDDDEEFGDDEDDEDDMLDEILGARRRRRKRGRGRSKGISKKKLLRMLALARRAGGAATRRKRRDKVREQPLPIPPTVFLTGQQLDIELRPQRLFRSERLTISSVIAPFFNVLDVKIGQETQFVASGALPAQIFSEVGVGVRLKGDTANLGNTIVISLQNIDTQTRTFGGAIIGTVITG